MTSDAVASGYDAVYTSMFASPTLRRIWREHAAGPDFPEEFGHISFVTLQELARIGSELRLAADSVLVDVGCGLAGPALWVARQAGCTLLGVDVSPVAVRLAGERAAALGMSGRARFSTGTFGECGLDSAVASGAMSEDALQYAPSKRAAFTEIARVLRPGGRFVFTAFELDANAATGLPVLGEDPVEDYGPLLREAGFEVLAYDEAPGWPEPMTSAYGALADARPAITGEMGEAASNALFAEVLLTLERKPYRRRVIAVAERSKGG